MEAVLPALVRPEAYLAVNHVVLVGNLTRFTPRLRLLVLVHFYTVNQFVCFQTSIGAELRLGAMAMQL